MITTFLTTAAALTLNNGATIGLAPGTNQVVTDIKGWTSPAPVRRVKTDRLWAHGSFGERGWRDERLVTLSGHIECGSRSEAAQLTDQLAATLADGTAGTFTVNDTDLGTRYATVYLTGTPAVDWDSGIEIDFTVDMIANDPRKYGPASPTSTPVSNPGGGLGLDLFTQNTPGILDFGANGSPGTATVTNQGTADAAPVHVVTGYAPGFTITETTTGARLIYTATVPAGHTLTLSAFDGSVMLDGNTDRSTYLSRREWANVPGSATGPTSRTFLFESPGADSNAKLTTTLGSAWW